MGAQDNQVGLGRIQLLGICQLNIQISSLTLYFRTIVDNRDVLLLTENLVSAGKYFRMKM